MKNIKWFYFWKKVRGRITSEDYVFFTEEERHVYENKEFLMERCLDWAEKIDSSGLNTEFEYGFEDINIPPKKWIDKKIDSVNNEIKKKEEYVSLLKSQEYILDTITCNIVVLPSDKPLEIGCIAKNFNHSLNSFVIVNQKFLDELKDKSAWKRHEIYFIAQDNDLPKQEPCLVYTKYTDTVHSYYCSEAASPKGFHLVIASTVTYPLIGYNDLKYLINNSDKITSVEIRREVEFTHEYSEVHIGTELINRDKEKEIVTKITKDECGRNTYWSGDTALCAQYDEYHNMRSKSPYYGILKPQNENGVVVISKINQEEKVK